MQSAFCPTSGLLSSDRARDSHPPAVQNGHSSPESRRFKNKSIFLCFLLNLRSGRVLRVFNSVTRHPNRLFGFCKSQNRIRPAMDFGSTRWASGRSDSGGLIGSFTRWTPLIHIFKNYFATVFFIFQFSAVSKRTLSLSILG